MEKYFVDTWFLVARVDPYDQHHRIAVQVERSLTRARFVTHDGVLMEFLTSFAADGARARAAAVATVRDCMLRYEVFPSDRDLFLRALSRYETRGDKQYSLVDCMSMVLMEERGIRYVLTNDHHFTQAGFIVVNS